MRFNVRSMGSAVGSSLKPILTVMVALSTVGLTACDDDNEILDPADEYDLTFSGDDTFNGAHGGQTVYVVLETQLEGTEVETANAVVSAAADPAFTFELDGVLSAGESYVIKYWIDSNFGGGTAGTCDAPSVDHQWRIDPFDEASLSNVSGPVTIVDTHRPTEVQDVCSGL